MQNTEIFNLISEVHSQSLPFEVDIAHFEIRSNPDNGEVTIEKSGFNRMNLMQIKDTIRKIEGSPLRDEHVMQETIRILSVAEKTIEDIVDKNDTGPARNIALHEAAQTFYDRHFAGKHIIDRHNNESSSTAHGLIKRILHLH